MLTSHALVCCVERSQSVQAALHSDETKPEDMVQEDALHSNHSWVPHPWDQAGPSPKYPPTPLLWGCQVINNNHLTLQIICN